MSKCMSVGLWAGERLRLCGPAPTPVVFLQRQRPRLLVLHVTLLICSVLVLHVIVRCHRASSFELVHVLAVHSFTKPSLPVAQPFLTFPHCGWLGPPSKTSVWSLDLEGGSQGLGSPGMEAFNKRNIMHAPRFPNTRNFCYDHHKAFDSVMIIIHHDPGPLLAKPSVFCTIW